MRQPLRLRRPFWSEPVAAQPAPAAADAPATDAPDVDARFLAQLHPLHRRYLAYRRGLQDGRPHTLEETAAHFDLDLATARLTERYLQERYRLDLERRGWRASQATAW